MKLQRHLRSIGFGILLGFTYGFLTNKPQIWLITAIAFAGVLIPNLDTEFFTKMGKDTGSIVLNFFMIPFLIMLMIPATLVTAFFIGYYGHVINDLDKANNIKFAVQRAFTGSLWILAILLIMVIFQLNFTQTMSLFG